MSRSMNVKSIMRVKICKKKKARISGEQGTLLLTQNDVNGNFFVQHPGKKEILLRKISGG